jgi:DNA-binding winged helix-turn-helix (wHTH) protein
LDSRSRVSVKFGDVVLPVEARRLERGGRPVHLSPKAFQLLALLVASRPKALSKFDIREDLWPKTFVAEPNLRALPTEVRAAMGDTGRKGMLVRTVHGFGYAFSGEVRETAPSSATRPPVVHRLSWAGDETEPTDGENVLGRDSDADVWIGDESVSRRASTRTPRGT